MGSSTSLCKSTLINKSHTPYLVGLLGALKPDNVWPNDTLREVPNVVLCFVVVVVG